MTPRATVRGWPAAGRLLRVWRLRLLLPVLLLVVLLLLLLRSTLVLPALLLLLLLLAATLLLLVMVVLLLLAKAAFSAPRATLAMRRRLQYAQRAMVHKRWSAQ